MDPAAYLVFAIFLLLLVAAILIPQVQKRRQA